MAAVEAQFCGVRTVMSDRVPEDAEVLNSTLRISLSCTAKEWADSILKQGNFNKNYDDKYDEYDISKGSVKLYFSEKGDKLFWALKNKLLLSSATKKLIPLNLYNAFI